MQEGLHGRFKTMCFVFKTSLRRRLKALAVVRHKVNKHLKASGLAELCNASGEDRALVGPELEWRICGLKPDAAVQMIHQSAFEKGVNAAFPCCCGHVLKSRDEGNGRVE